MAASVNAARCAFMNAYFRRGMGETFTLRKVCGGVGVERVCPLQAPS